MDVKTFRNDLSNLFEDQISNLVFCIIQTINLTYAIDYLVFILRYERFIHLEIYHLSITREI